MEEAEPIKGKIASPVASHDRLYQEAARKLFAQRASGKFKIGDRLPAERDLAETHSVSRPTVREAIIALEVLGYVDVRIGSCGYVKKLAGAADAPEFNVTAFELTEARRWFTRSKNCGGCGHLRPNRCCCTTRRVTHTSPRWPTSTAPSSARCVHASRPGPLGNARASRCSTRPLAVRDRGKGGRGSAAGNHFEARAVQPDRSVLTRPLRLHPDRDRLCHRAAPAAEQIRQRSRVLDHPADNAAWADCDDHMLGRDVLAALVIEPAQPRAPCVSREPVTGTTCGPVSGEHLTIVLPATETRRLEVTFAQAD